MKKLPLILLAGMLVFTSCKKDKEEETPTPTTPTAPTAPPVTSNPYYFTAKFNGSKKEAGAVTNVFNFNAYTNGSGQGTSSGSGNYVTELYTLFLTMKDAIYSSTTSPRFEVGFIDASLVEPTSDGEYEAMISTGSYGYGKEDGLSTVEGVYVKYYDHTTNKVWSTNLGTGDQTGSTFNVTNYVDNPNYNNDYILKVFTATFSCKLYDDSGNSITVTEGKVKGRIVLGY